METGDTLLVTPDDHDAGFKDVEVIYRSGRTETVRFHAPSRRALKAMIFESTKGADLDALLIERASGRDKGWLDKLDFSSATHIERVVALLAFGTDTQKKMGEMVAQRATPQTTPPNGSARSSQPSASASAEVSPPEKCADGVSPS